MFEISFIFHTVNRLVYYTYYLKAEIGIYVVYMIPKLLHYKVIPTLIDSGLGLF